MKRNLKTSTIIILIVTIIALEVGIALYDHNLSLDTIYFAAILICIVLLLAHEFLKRKKVHRKRDEENRSSILAIYFTIYRFFCSYKLYKSRLCFCARDNWFSCFITYGGFVCISILKGKVKIKGNLLS